VARARGAGGGAPAPVILDGTEKSVLVQPSIATVVLPRHEQQLR